MTKSGIIATYEWRHSNFFSYIIFGDFYYTRYFHSNIYANQFLTDLAQKVFGIFEFGDWTFCFLISQEFWVCCLVLITILSNYIFGKFFVWKIVNKWGELTWLIIIISKEFMRIFEESTIINYVEISGNSYQDLVLIKR